MTTSRSEADIFVVESLDTAGERVLLAASLKGGYVAAPAAIISKTGPAWKYVKSAVSRSVFIGARFTEKNPGIVEILKGAAVPAWKFITEDEFVKAKSTKAGKKNASIISILDKTDVKKFKEKHEALHGLHQYTVESLLSSFGKLDRSLTMSGVGGR